MKRHINIPNTTFPQQEISHYINITLFVPGVERFCINYHIPKDCQFPLSQPSFESSLVIWLTIGLLARAKHAVCFRMVCFCIPWRCQNSLGTEFQTSKDVTEIVWWVALKFLTITFSYTSWWMYTVVIRSQLYKWKALIGGPVGALETQSSQHVKQV